MHRRINQHTLRARTRACDQVRNGLKALEEYKVKVSSQQKSVD
jgi:hypothetical protein